MLYMTPKARDIVDRAIRRTHNLEYARIWENWVNEFPDADYQNMGMFPRLTGEAAPVVHAALHEFSVWLEDEIQRGDRSEDTLADMDNDLSFIEAIETDLAHNLC